MSWSYLLTLVFLFQQLNDELPFTRDDQRYTKLVRGVDMHALYVWIRKGHELFDPLFGKSFSSPNPRRFTPHDGLSWKEREEKYHFHVIGLVPNECFRSSVRFSMAPYPVDQILGYPKLSLGEIIGGGYLVTAEAFHFYMSQYAKQLCDRELLGPLACRTIVVLMHNEPGVCWGRDFGENIYADTTANLMETYIFHTYIDPEAAQKFIAENVRNEEELKRMKAQVTSVIDARLEREAQKEWERQQKEQQKAEGGRP